MALSGIGSSGSGALSGLNAAQSKQQKAIAQLVSGLKINGAADDAAGLSISTGLDSQIRGYKTASANAQNGIGLLQTADGGLGQTTNLLQRVRDLTVQAANTTDAGALNAISQEIDQSVQQIDQISQGTTFGSSKLLDGSLAGGTKFQVGSESSDSYNVAIASSASSALGVGGLADAIRNGGASAALSTIDSAITTVTTNRSKIGAAQNSLESTVNNLTNQAINVAASKSRITDADMAESVMNNALAGIQRQASTAMLAQSNANAGSYLKLLGG